MTDSIIFSGYLQYRNLFLILVSTHTEWNGTKFLFNTLTNCTALCNSSKPCTHGCP